MHLQQNYCGQDHIMQLGWSGFPMEPVKHLFIGSFMQIIENHEILFKQ